MVERIESERSLRGIGSSLVGIAAVAFAGAVYIGIGAFYRTREEIKHGYYHVRGIDHICLDPLKDSNECSFRKYERI